MEGVPDAPRSRRLAPRVQAGALAGVVLLLVVALGVTRCAHASRPPPVAAAAATGPFRPTAEERANLVIAPAALHVFPSVVTTDGRVALDDERSVQIFPPFTGRVTRVFVTLGQQVRAGQPLAAFEANEVVQAQADMANALASRAQARVTLTAARAALGRQSALRALDAASQHDVEQAQTDVAAAVQALASADAGLQGAQGRLRVLNLSAQTGRLEAAAADKRFLAEAVITAPSAGEVTARQVGPGQFVDSVAGGASQPLLTVSDLHRVWLVANVREADAAEVRRGAEMEARVPALPGRVFRARVTYVGAVVDANIRRVVIRGEIDNPGGELRPDMFAELTVGVGAPRTSVAVPAAAVVFDGKSSRVWVEDASGALALRPVEVGRSEGSDTEVLSGLRAGERVVTGGAIFVDQAGAGDA